MNRILFHITTLSCLLRITLGELIDPLNEVVHRSAASVPGDMIIRVAVSGGGRSRKRVWAHLSRWPVLSPSVIVVVPFLQDTCVNIGARDSNFHL